MRTFLGFKEALALTLSSVPITESVILPLDRLAGLILSKDLISKVDCPSINSSLKDGYAVLSSDLQEADDRNMKRLKVSPTTSRAMNIAAAQAR